MLASKLNELLIPFAVMANRHALSLNYRVIEVQPDKLRACSSYGILEAKGSLGLDRPFVLDATTFCAVAKSLPEEELELKLEGDTLHWACGLASGKLATIRGDVQIPEMKAPESEQFELPDARQFSEGIAIGGLSCGDASMTSVGLYGVVLDNRSLLQCYASDDASISSCTIGENVGCFPDQITFSRDAARLLSLVLKGGYKSLVAINDKFVHVQTPDLSLALRPVQSLKKDVAKLRDNYAQALLTAPIPPERVAAFIRRATAISESARFTFVDIQAVNGAISLSFNEDKAVSEEYYLAEGLALPADLPAIRVEASRMARALVHVEKIVLDHLGKSVISFVGSDPPFVYILSGRREAKAAA